MKGRLNRSAAISVLTLIAACSSKSPPPAADTFSAAPDTRVAATDAVDAHAAADITEAVDAASAVDARVTDGARESDVDGLDLVDSLGSVDAAPAPAASEPTVVAGSASASEGFLSLRGFPGVSGDGMHLALLVGDPTGARGPLVVRLTRIDGSVLLEKPLIEKGEARDLAEPSDEAHESTLRRRIAARAKAAQRVLAKANMRSLARATTPAEGGTTIVAKDDQLSVTLPGYVVGHYPRALLDRGCATPTTLADVYTDSEHGLVVTRLESACTASDEWQVFALTALP